MPELPEVERVRVTLLPHVRNALVCQVLVHRTDVIESCSPQASLHQSLLCGATIADVRRLGKQLALVTREGPALCVHLGMTGQLRALPCGPGPATHAPHTHICWLLHAPTLASTTQPSLAPNVLLTFRDPRRFGGVWTYPSFEAMHEHRWKLLGPDGLTVTGSHLSACLAHAQRPIKAALLDQHVVAGVGNIYADEALFAARIRPHALCCRLKRSHYDALADALRTGLARALAQGGSTLRDYVDADGAAGLAQLQHQVYGRAQQPCLRCATPLRSARLAQRTTVWCPSCQASATRAQASSQGRRITTGD